MLQCVFSFDINKAPAIEVLQESFTLVSNVDADRFDLFTLFSAPSETLSLIDELQLIHEPKHTSDLIARKDDDE